MSIRSAACAHWNFRCCVGTTTTTRRIARARSARRAAVRAKVVLPAPGVATARKLGDELASNCASASRCHARNPAVPRRAGWGEVGSRPVIEAPWVKKKVYAREGPYRGRSRRAATARQMRIVRPTAS